MVKTKLSERIVTELAEIMASNQASELIRQMLQAGILDERRCKIALIRRYVEGKVVENQRAGKQPSVMAIMSEAAEIYCVSETFVQNAMYKFRGVNL